MNRRIVLVLSSVSMAVLLLFLVVLSPGHCCSFESKLNELKIKQRNNTLSTPHRRLLHGTTVNEPNRLPGEKCNKADIVINQGTSSPLPNGIPVYTVQILNTCVSGCDISGIHVNCGWFSSARLVNPSSFRRLSYNDCVVNNGESLKYGTMVSFEYANSFSYPLSVSSISC